MLGGCKVLCTHRYMHRWTGSVLHTCTCVKCAHATSTLTRANSIFLNCAYAWKPPELSNGAPKVSMQRHLYMLKFWEGRKEGRRRRRRRRSEEERSHNRGNTLDVLGPLYLWIGRSPILGEQLECGEGSIGLDKASSVHRHIFGQCVRTLVPGD